MAVRTTSSMGVITPSANANTITFCNVSINGILDNVFVGKKRTYATIKVNRGEYYDMFKVSCPLDFDFPADGATITLSCKATTFFDKSINRTLINFEVD